MIEEAESKLDSRDYIDIFLILAIVVFIGILIYAIFIFKVDGIQCLSDPVTYFEHYKNVTCECRQSKVFDGTPLNLTNFSFMRG